MHTNVPRRTHQVQRNNLPERIGNAEHAPLQIIHGKPRRNAFVQRPPAGVGRHFQLRQIDRAEAERLLRVQLEFLEHGHQPRDQHVAEGQRAISKRLLLEHVEHLDARVQIRVRIIIDVNAAHIGLFLGKIQLFNLILLPFMHINRVLMQQHRHGVAIHFADHNAVLRPCDINNQKIFAGDGAKRQIRRREFLRHPVIPPAGQIQNVLLAEIIEKLARRYALRVAFTLFKRKLICRAFDVPQQHIQIIRMYQRVFR